MTSNIHETKFYGDQVSHLNLMSHFTKAERSMPLEMMFKDRELEQVLSDTANVVNEEL